MNNGATSSSPSTEPATKSCRELRRARRSVEADVICRALRQTDGNRTHAAKLLEVSHRTLLYKIKEYEIRD